jgi:hypothetical protein
MGSPVPSISRYMIRRGWPKGIGRSSCLAMRICCSSRGYIRANGLCVTLDGFGGHLRTGQYFQLLPAVIKRGIAADQGHHPADAGRMLGPLHI